MEITRADEFIQQRVQPEHHEIVEMLRSLMHEAAPDAKEVVTYGILGWRGNLILAVISPTKKISLLPFRKVRSSKTSMDCCRVPAKYRNT